MERPAWVHFDGWAGRRTVAVHVVGETPRRYRVRIEQDRCKWAGRSQWKNRGDTVLVPKHAVTFS